MRSRAKQFAVRRLLATMTRLSEALDAERQRQVLQALEHVGPGCHIGSVDVVTNPHHIRLGSHIFVRSHIRLEAVREHAGYHYDGHITIDSGCHIESYVHIGAAYSVDIGANVVMASRVTIIDHDHGISESSESVMYQPLVGAPIVIGAGCWIGEGATVLKGASLGEACVVGANAVVTRSFPPQSIVVGVPARPIAVRMRQRDIIQGACHG
jgi:lipopolysaccharide O-acetyltransferase